MSDMDEKESRIQVPYIVYEGAMAVIDDLMNALSVLNPRLYESVIDRL